MPIEILQKEVQVRDPTTHQFSDLAALCGGQGPQGPTGPGVPAGGTDGDVLVKNGATDYTAKWEKPQYCRPNLLDNWYFVGGGSQQGGGQFPINQRGQSYYPNAGYCIDRWKIVNGSLTLQNTGLLLSQAACFLIQSLSDGVKDALDGKTLTFSYLDSYNHLVTGSTVYRKQPAENIYFTVGDHYQLLISTNGDPLIWCADLTALLSAVKLELGSYQTLAHQEDGQWVLNEIPDWNVERYKCDPTIGSNLATVEHSNTASKLYNPGEYLVYNGQLYKVGGTAIGQGETLNPGQGGNITLVTVMEHLYDSGLIDLYRSGDHYVTYRKLNGVVYINARIPSTANQRVWTIGTLPIGFRPATRAFTSAVFTDVSPINAYLNITTDGGVALVNWDNSAHPDIYFQTSFTV